MKSIWQLGLLTAVGSLWLAGTAGAQSPLAVQPLSGYGAPMAMPQLVSPAAMGVPLTYTPHGMPFYDPALLAVAYDEYAGASEGYYEEVEGEFNGAVEGDVDGSFEECSDCGGGGGCGKFFGAGACACPDHWYDFHVEYMYWRRDTVSRVIPFTSSGTGPGTIVLDSDDLGFDSYEPGIRVSASFVFKPGYDLEMSYFGMFERFEDGAQATGTNDLFSTFSDFGTNPGPTGFPETDEASLHTLAYSSDMHSGEINVRRRWKNANCRLQGSILYGARYFRLVEDLAHDTSDTASGESLEYDLETVNDMIGFQTGGDLYLCVLPGVMVGGEAEAGIYAIRTKNESVMNATTVANPLVEEVETHDVSFVAEASAVTIVQLTRRTRFRGALTVLYLDGVGLATENFDPNRTGPDVVTPAAMPFVNDNGNALYYSYTGGLEVVY